MGPRLDDSSADLDHPNMATVIKSSSTSSSSPLVTSTSRRRPRSRHDDSPTVAMENGRMHSPYSRTMTTRTTNKSTPERSILGSSSLQSRNMKSMMMTKVQEESSPSSVSEPHPSLDDQHRHSHQQQHYHHHLRRQDQQEHLMFQEQWRLFQDSSNSSSMPSSFPEQSSYQPKQQQTLWMILAWSLHLMSSILVLIYGTYANQGNRKYVPIDISKVESQLIPCHKAFVDVFSSSLEDPGAMVCCRDHVEINDDAMSPNPMICVPPPSYLPFSRRLAKFPDAWILPLFPLLLRSAVQWYHRQYLSSEAGRSLSSSLHVPSWQLDNVYSQRRLYLYLGLIQLRGWVLYVVFDELEEFFVSSGGEGCWYEDYLHSDYQDCQGRQMDFSDHVVLYFAQIIPIALVEILHALFPRGGGPPYYQWWLSARLPRQPRTNTVSGYFNRFFHHVVPLILSLWMVNLYVVTFLGAFKTAAYFHTGPEVWVGFVISLLVQIPLMVLQTTNLFPKQQEYFFGSL